MSELNKEEKRETSNKEDLEIEEWREGDEEKIE